MDKELYSYHVFLFPFQWSYQGKEYANAALEKKTSLEKFKGLLEASGKWNQETFQLDTRLKYNEYNYFYNFVREVMYDQRSSLLAHYMFDIPAETWEYVIELGSGKTYRLSIDSILLHLYSTGVGVLSFHLMNRLESQSDPNDILNINQFGRRIFPPFIGLANAEIGPQSQFATGHFAEGLELVQQIELAKAITIGDPAFREDFTCYQTWDPDHKNPFRLPRCFQHILEGLPLETELSVSGEADFGIHITPLLDDRMFVISWFGNEKLIGQYCKDGSAIPKGDKLAYETNSWWYKYMHLDKPNGDSCANGHFMEDLIKKGTNARWVGYGTLFGVTRYSFVILTNPLHKLKEFNSAFLVNHVQTMYYKLVEISLLQRACVLRFSDEVHEISMMDAKNASALANNVQSLYKQYIRFVNKIYFREVTAQEQGIELYDLLQSQMRIADHVKSLDDEITELHNYVMMVQEQERGRNIDVLTKLGAAFVLPGFLVALLGLDSIKNGGSWQQAGVVACLGLVPCALLFFMRRNKAVKWWQILLLIVGQVGLLVFLLKM